MNDQWYLALSRKVLHLDHLIMRSKVIFKSVYKTAPLEIFLGYVYSFLSQHYYLFQCIFCRIYVFNRILLFNVSYAYTSEDTHCMQLVCAINFHSC